MHALFSPFIEFLKGDTEGPVAQFPGSGFGYELHMVRQEIRSLRHSVDALARDAQPLSNETTRDASTPSHREARLRGFRVFPGKTLTCRGKRAPGINDLHVSGPKFDCTAVDASLL
jgi:hypothetical protein